MDKKLLAVALGIVALIIAGFAYLLLQDKPRSSPSNSSVQKQESPTANEPAQPPAGIAKGAYLAYSEQAVSTAKGTKILFFHAAWCPQCRELEADIKAGKIPDGVTIFKVDYDSNQKLRQKYGVSLQTTLVRVDDNGNIIKKFVAYDEPTLQALIKNLL